MRLEVNKAKKARRITKLLSSPEARRAMDRLKIHAKYVVVILTSAYVVAFTVMQIMGNQHYHVIDEIQTVSLLAAAVPIAAVNARVLQSAYDGNGVVNNADAAAVKVVMDEMLTQASVIETLAQKVYLGESDAAVKPGAGISALFEAKDFVIEEWVDAAPMRFEFVTSSFWDAIKMYYQNTRKVVHRAESKLDLSLTREWRFLIRNGIERVSAKFDELLDKQKIEAMNDAKKIEAVLGCVLALNLAIFLVIVIHFYRLLQRVSDERLGLYTVFVSIPRPIVMKLATKKITTGDDEDSDDGSDEEDVAMVKLKKEQQQQQQQHTKAIGEGPAGEAGGAGAVAVAAVPGGILSRPSAGGALRRTSLDGGAPAGVNAAMVNMAQPQPRLSNNNGGGDLSAETADTQRGSHGSTAPRGFGGRFKNMVVGVMHLMHVGIVGGTQVVPYEQISADKQSGSSIKFAKSGRKIDPKGSNLNSFLVPLCFWGCVTILSFSFSYWQFSQTNAPAKSLAVAARVEVLATSARFYAHDLVLSAGSPAHVPLGDRNQVDEVAYLRSSLHNVTEEMFELYENILLGGGKYDLQGSLHHSFPKHDALLFDHGCLRLAGEHLSPPCVTFGHDYYYRTTAGLDNLLRHYREACLLLALDAVDTLNVTNPRFKFIWEAGMYDVRGGLRSNTELFMDEVRIPPQRDQIIQICALVLTLVAKVYFVRYLFMPWYKATKTESNRIAELLAQLPAEIDMHAVIAEQLLMKRDEEIDFNAVK